MTKKITKDDVIFGIIAVIMISVIIVGIYFYEVHQWNTLPHCNHNNDCKEYCKSYCEMDEPYEELDRYKPECRDNIFGGLCFCSCRYKLGWIYAEIGGLNEGED